MDSSTVVPPASETITEVLYVPLSQLVTGPNVRAVAKDEAFEELVASVKRQGVLQSLLVRPTPEGLQVVAGNRRHAAATEAKIEKVPVVVRSMTDAEVTELQLIENGQREGLHPLDEALALAQLKEFYEKQGASAAEALKALQEKLSKGRSHVYDTLSLVKLGAKSREAFWAGKVTLSQAVELARLAPELQEEALEAITAVGKSHRESLDHLRRKYASKDKNLVLYAKAVEEAAAKKIPVLSMDVCKTVYPWANHNGSAKDGGYIGVDEEWFNYATYKHQKVEALIKGANIQRYLAQDADAWPRWVVKRADIKPLQAALEQKGKKVEPKKKDRAEVILDNQIERAADEKIGQAAVAAVTEANALSVLAVLVAEEVAAIRDCHATVEMPAKATLVGLVQTWVAVRHANFCSISEDVFAALKVDPAQIEKEMRKKLVAAAAEKAATKKAEKAPKAEKAKKAKGGKGK
jgi:ParB/RepB/Spo0J family partition protein